MRRFITYVYEYKDGKKIKNMGFIRIDVKENRMQLMLNIKAQNLNDEKGDLILYVKEEEISELLLGEIVLCNGEYVGKFLVDLEEKDISLQNVIGAVLRYEDGTYMASCWKDGEEDFIAVGGYQVINEVSMEKEEWEPMEQPLDLQVANLDTTITYCKINLQEIQGLPRRHWYYGNNSFLIHGFWNYGYLVLKESFEKDRKRISLGVPGVYAQPEMVMATYFGFPIFESIPTQVAKMEVGQNYSVTSEMKNQQTKEGLFGCWFVDL